MRHKRSTRTAHLPRVWRDDLDPAFRLFTEAVTSTPAAVSDAIKYAAAGMMLLRDAPDDSIPKQTASIEVGHALGAAALLLCRHNPALAEVWGPQAVKAHLTALLLVELGVEPSEAVKATPLWLKALRPGMKGRIIRRDGRPMLDTSEAPRPERKQVNDYYERQNRLLRGEPTGPGKPPGSKKRPDPLFEQRQRDAARRLWDGGQTDEPTETALAEEIGIRQRRYAERCDALGLSRIPEWPPPGAEA